MNFCKDCKHCKLFKSHWSLIDTYHCYHDNNMKIDTVTGYNYRVNNIEDFRNNTCKGNFFEKKIESV